MKKELLPITRIKDYEFLGLFTPKENADNFFYIYDIELENNITGRIFYSSVYNNILLKGDVVEYDYNKDGKLLIRIPKKKATFIDKSTQQK
jgi:hypothetical protein